MLLQVLYTDPDNCVPYNDQFKDILDTFTKG